MKTLDLIKLTSQVGTSYRLDIKGEKINEFKQVLITINKPNGNKKKYEITREANQGRFFFKHRIETYSLLADPLYHKGKHHSRYKTYNTDDEFDIKLKRLEKELSKLDYKVRVVG